MHTSAVINNLDALINKSININIKLYKLQQELRYTTLPVQLANNN
jgi:hypothetical protein